MNRTIQIDGKRVAGSTEIRTRKSDRSNLSTPPILHFIVKGEPMGKPRMTQRDKWMKRLCTDRYWEWCDKLRNGAGITEKLRLEGPRKVTVFAYFSMPKSWPNAKKLLAAGQPHANKPDADNIIKGVLDALFINDSMVSDERSVKRWDDGFGPRLEVTIEEVPSA